MTQLPITISGAGLVHCLGGKDRLAARLPLAGTEPPDLAELGQRLPSVPLRRVPRLARMALLAALRAQEEAGPADPMQTALVLGSAYGSVQMNMDFMDSILNDGPRLSSPTAFSYSVNNMCSGLVGLLLGLRAPCLALSQFELSFAGALATGISLLRSGRVRRVLACMADERDLRFTKCCPQVETPDAPFTEGAVCICLEPAAPGQASIEVRWGQAARAEGLTLLSGSAQGEGVRHAAVYGQTPLAHALDCLLALSMVRSGETDAATCLCADLAHGRQAGISIRS